MGRRPETGRSSYRAGSRRRAGVFWLSLCLPAALSAEPPADEPRVALDLTAGVARVLPAVARIRSYAPPAPGATNPQPSRLLASGGGLVFDAERGHLVTVHHIVAGADRLVVSLADGRAFAGELVGGDPAADVAVVAVPATGLTAAPVGSSVGLCQGQAVFTVSHPFDEFPFSVSSGVVSALDRSFAAAGRVYEGLVQTDAAINRGASGGPLCTVDGGVVGLDVAIFSPSGAPLGIGFALPIEFVLRRARYLSEHGAVPYLGLTAATVTVELAAELRLPVTTGVAVLAVASAGPAARAGLRRDDVIGGLGDQAVTTRCALLEALLDHQLGDQVTLQVRRGQTTRQLTIALVRRPEGEPGGI